MRHPTKKELLKQIEEDVKLTYVPKEYFTEHWTKQQIIDYKRKQSNSKMCLEKFKEELLKALDKIK